MAEMLGSLTEYPKVVISPCIPPPPLTPEMIRQWMSLNKTSENDPKCTTEMYQIPTTRRLFFTCKSSSNDFEKSLNICNMYVSEVEHY